MQQEPSPTNLVHSARPPCFPQWPAAEAPNRGRRVKATALGRLFTMLLMLPSRVLVHTIMLKLQTCWEASNSLLRAEILVMPGLEPPWAVASLILGRRQWAVTELRGRRPASRPARASWAFANLCPKRSWPGKVSGVHLRKTTAPRIYRKIRTRLATCIA